MRAEINKCNTTLRKLEYFSGEAVTIHEGMIGAKRNREEKKIASGADSSDKL